MNASSSPRDPGSSRRAYTVPGGTDRYESLLEVLEAQAERADADARRSRRGKGRARGRLKLGLLATLVAVTVWLWVLPPAWLVPPPPAPPTAAEEEASLRFGIYLQAQRIRVYQLEHGTLPATLEAAGPPVPGMSYAVVAPGVYELTGETERVRVTYRSTEPLREWVGPDVELLGGG